MRSGLIAEHFASHQVVVERSANQLQAAAEEVARALISALKDGHKVIAFGNGGSASQASHLVGELLGRFAMTRQPFPAIALASDSATVTCIANDFSYEVLFERQVQALAQPGDIALGFTTGGAGLVGGTADHVLAVPSDVTAHIQEVHLMLLHVWCIYIDENLGQAQS
jgi:D-sedoheptulose 7-phosphate isomerase